MLLLFSLLLLLYYKCGFHVVCYKFRIIKPWNPEREREKKTQSDKEMIYFKYRIAEENQEKSKETNKNKNNKLNVFIATTDRKSNVKVHLLRLQSISFLGIFRKKSIQQIASHIQ